MRKILCCMLAAALLLLLCGGAHSAAPQTPPDIAPVEQALRALTADAPGVWQYRLNPQADGGLLAADALRRRGDGTWESIQTLWQPAGKTWRMVRLLHRRGAAVP